MNAVEMDAYYNGPCPESCGVSAGKILSNGKVCCLGCLSLKRTLTCFTFGGLEDFFRRFFQGEDEGEFLIPCISPQDVMGYVNLSRREVSNIDVKNPDQLLRTLSPQSALNIEDRLGISAEAILLNISCTSFVKALFTANKPVVVDRPAAKPVHGLNKVRHLLENPVQIFPEGNSWGDGWGNGNGWGGA